MSDDGSISLVLAAVPPALLVFWAWCLVDFSRTDERDMRTFTRPVWLVLLVFGSVVGGLVWLFAGRPERR